MAFDRPKTEDIEKLFSRMDSAKKDRFFSCPFPMPDDESWQNLLKTAENAGIKKLSFAECDYFGSNHVQMLARNLHLAPNLEGLNLNDSKPGKKGGIALLKALETSKIKELSLNRVELPDAAVPLLLNVAKNTPLEILSLHQTSMGEKRFGFLEKLSKVLPDTNIRDLDIEGVISYPEGCRAFVEIMNRTKLVSLSFSSFNDPKAQNIFIDSLPNSTIRRLNMRGCYDFKEPEAIRLMQMIPNTEISYFYFSASSRFSDAFFKEAEKMLKSGQNRLENVFITTFNTPHEKSKDMLAAREALLKNVAYRKSIAQKTAEKKNVEKAPEGITLCDALETGVLPQALAGRKKPLSAAECLASDAAGIPFIQKAARAEQLALIFKTSLWVDAKEFQKTWQNVDEQHKWQMDGKNGRPSYQKIKNEIMRKAVYTNLNKRNAGR